jgi:hypothetical protein
MIESYVYELTVGGIVRYIGMGKGHRINAHTGIAKRINRKISRGENVSAQRIHLMLADAIRRGLAISSRFVAVGLPNEIARALETHLISQAPKGQLWNVHPGGGGATSERMIELWADPLWRNKQTNALRAKWHDPEYRQNMLEIRSDQLIRDRISKFVKDRFSDPNERLKQSDRLKAAHAASPNLAANQSAAMRAKWQENREAYSRAVTAHWANPAQRERQSNAAKLQWADPESRKKLSRAAKECWTTERRAARKAHQKMLWKDPDYRKRMLDARKRIKPSTPTDAT